MLLNLCYEVTVMEGDQGGWGREPECPPEMLWLCQSLGNDCGSLGVYSDAAAVAQSLSGSFVLKSSSI